MINLKKLVTIIVTLTLLVFTFSGCLPSASVIDYRTGTKGLLFSIEGPNEITIYGNEPSPYEEYEIKIENDGATKIEDQDIYVKIDLKDGFLKMKSDGSNYATLNSLDAFNLATIHQLEGKTKWGFDGEDISHFFTLEALARPNQGVTAIISAELCYRYETILSDSICINTIKHRDGGGCSRSDYPYGGQGGPIKISKVEVREIVDDRGDVTPRIVLTIQNAEGGIVSLPDGDNFKEGCLAKEEINKLKITEALLGQDYLTCNDGDDEITLVDGEKRVVCELGGQLPENPQGYFDTTLYIELEYGFHSIISKTVDIIRKNY